MSNLKFTEDKKYAKDVPREINLGYATFTLVFCSKLEDTSDDGDEFLFGATSFPLKKIFVLVTEDDRFNRETAHHELLHVAFFSSGMTEVSKLDIEPMVMAASQQMFILEGLNPELFDWVWGRCKE